MYLIFLSAVKVMLGDSKESSGSVLDKVKLHCVSGSRHFRSLTHHLPECFAVEVYDGGRRTRGVVQ